VVLAFLVLSYYVHGIVPAGYTSLIVSVWFLGGLIMFCIGVVAVYLSVIFVETKQRPFTTIRQIYDHDSPTPK
jgi:putative glycosyltransferase